MSWTNGALSQKRALDMLGNWKELQTDKNADGDYVDSNETEDRTHNAANEIVTLDPDGSGNMAMTHDDNGNRLSFGDTDYTHDAWNRLVRVDDQTNTLDYGEYEYYGLHWRSLKRSDTAQAPDGTLDEERMDNGMLTHFWVL